MANSYQKTDKERPKEIKKQREKLINTKKIAKKENKKSTKKKYIENIVKKERVKRPKKLRKFHKNGQKE